MQKVTFSLYANYNDNSKQSEPLRRPVLKRTALPTAEMTMYPPPNTRRDDSVDYFFKAKHIRGETGHRQRGPGPCPWRLREIVLQKGD